MNRVLFDFSSEKRLRPFKSVERHLTTSPTINCRCAIIDFLRLYRYLFMHDITINIVERNDTSVYTEIDETVSSIEYRESGLI